MHHVHPDAALEQRRVAAHQRVRLAGQRGRPRVQLRRPPALPVEQQRHLAGDSRPGEIRHPRKLRAERLDLGEDPAVRPGVRHHPGVELLRPATGLPPLEVEHPVGAVRDRLQAGHAKLPGPLRHVDRPPVDRRRRMLHQQPRLAAPRRPDDVVRQPRPQMRPRVCGIGVAVNAGEVGVHRPFVHIDRFEQAEEVSSYPNGRCDTPQDRLFRQVAGEHGVVAEPREVELLCRVGVRGRYAWRQDLPEVGVALRPEGGRPRLVQRADVAYRARSQSRNAAADSSS